jgi:hypothetical protein
VTAMKRMTPEVGARCETGKQHKHLSYAGARPHSSIMRI